eukprot:CAMPEP_0204563304 /NCGR_PEP_ID=MMETSP0661-20131031/34235_1 /ASSEMBLY_ACC=CAM_ASM_000606 /TAXON_ID=109239 /ORGANISM="Alexandrium margalefi, Strain AMGDE01CS-322" /LENGTH=360 /DNA_ID=CAMNT_0051570851 /DNA_START=49 /DNA_END=1127 /DNA_ORIENTATION=-
MFALRLLAALWVADALHLGGPKLLPIDGTWMPLSQLFLAGPENCEAKVSTALHHLESTLSYEHRFRVQEAFEDANATTMLIVGTRHTTCMTDNFLVHADSLTTPSPIVHVALDSLAHRSCTEHFQPRSRSLACVDLSSWLPIDVSSYGPTTSLSDNVGFGTCAYRLIAWTKPLLLKVALSATPQRIFLIDTDVILYADLAGWIERNAREDSLLVAGDEYMRRLPNTGTLVTDAASRPLLDLWLARAGDPDDHMPATGARFADQGGARPASQDEAGLQPHSPAGAEGGAWPLRGQGQVREPLHLRRQDRGDASERGVDSLAGSVPRRLCRGHAAVHEHRLCRPEPLAQHLIAVERRHAGKE